MNDENNPGKVLSVILPLVNAEKNVLSLVESVHHQITSRFAATEIIAVDGQSTDHTWAILRELTNAYPELRIFRTKEASLAGTCSMRGFVEASGRMLFHMEPHCPWQPRIFWEMIRLWESDHPAGVFAVREKSLRRLKERTLARICQDELREAGVAELPDPASPAQLISRHEFEKMHILLPEQCAAPGSMLYLLFHLCRRKTNTWEPPASFLAAGQDHLPPQWFSSLSAFQNGRGQIRTMLKNIQRIQGLMNL